MDANAVLSKLKENEVTLRERGVRHAALFGSIARGDNRPNSDIDILLDFDPEERVTIYDYVGIKDYISGLFQDPVDVVDRAALKPHLRKLAATDLMYAF